VSFAEKLLYCNSCKKNFIFSIEEQEFHSYQGYPNDPAFCPSCRRSRKSRTVTNVEENANSRLQMYPVVCTQCRRTIRVPFQPRQGKPVVCSDCQMKIKASKSMRSY
jgi:CxxC-x17-CxxC domain-containing protein